MQRGCVLSTLCALGLIAGPVSAASFIVPFNAKVSFTASGGSAGAVTEFGLGTSQATAVPLITGMPNSPSPNGAVSAGLFAAGTPLNVYLKSEFGGIDFAFSNDVVTAPSRTAFLDLDNSLGFGGSIYEQKSPTTYLMHLDDARSYGFDDDDDDVLITITLQAVPEPTSLMMLGVGIAGLAARRRCR